MFCKIHFTSYFIMLANDKSGNIIIWRITWRWCSVSSALYFLLRGGSTAVGEDGDVAFSSLNEDYTLMRIMEYYTLNTLSGIMTFIMYVYNGDSPGGEGD